MANIVFVDEKDNVIGAGTKQEVWEKGIIHRIARVFIFNSKGEVLIQKRADDLDSLPGRWDQSAAGHVDEGEEYLVAAKRELEEEVGVRGIELQEIKKFYTDEVDEDEKIKKRFNMLYRGLWDGAIIPNEEVPEVKWITPADLNAWIEKRPNDFTQGCARSFKVLQETML